MSQPTYQEMTEVYNAVVGVSTFKKIMEKNKRLEREVRSLKNILYSIPEFRCKCNRVNSHSATVDLRTIAPGATVCDLRHGAKKEHRRTKLRKDAVVKEEDGDDVVVVIKQEKIYDPVVVLAPGAIVVVDDVVPLQENVLMNIFEKNDQACISTRAEVADRSTIVEETKDVVTSLSYSASTALRKVGLNPLHPSVGVGLVPWRRSQTVAQWTILRMHPRL